jgi:membrane protein DedA with SNARE-associated domain
VWCLGLAGIGWGLGSSWDRFHSDFRYVEYAVVAIAVIGGVLWLLRARRPDTMTRHDDSAR